MDFVGCVVLYDGSHLVYNAGPQLEWLAPVDPCQPGVSNYHMICVTGAQQKEQVRRG